ncbi:MAG: sigma-70 family RNA polymerase sigma factor [Oscillospiraceae bacterium]|nr:sigma-70 family RNA polymerase sigma factor [Oscillospiraceae bacterium]
MKNTHFESFDEVCREMTLHGRRDNRASIERVHRSLQLACTNELTPRQAELLQLHFEGGMSMRQIAREQGISPSTVSRTIARAEERLRRCLQYAF